MRTNSDKLNNLLLLAEKDLDIWLYYTNTKTLEEFYSKEEQIKNKSIHSYDDVIRQIQYIDKIKLKIRTINATRQN